MEIFAIVGGFICAALWFIRYRPGTAYVVVFHGQYSTDIIKGFHSYRDARAYAVALNAGQRYDFYTVKELSIQ